MLAATLLGADRAREPSRPVDTAREALDRVLELGPGDPAVLESLADIRAQMGQRPLDARTRVLYAALLLEMASGHDDCKAAAFHAGRSSELAPVTVWVIRAATLVLTRCGETDGASSLIRDMFGYEPESAADLLIAAEPFLDRARVERAVPPSPAAWLAWSRQLRAEGRSEEADRWADEAHRRWPENLDTLHDVTSRAALRGDWARLALLLPPDRALPEKREWAILFAYRARTRAEARDFDGARADVELAMSLSGSSGGVLLHVGDALEAMGDTDGARRAWRRGLFESSAKQESTRLRARLLTRVARLEDLHGEPAAALRAWRDVLELQPDHAEALRRVGELDVLGR
jgi:tetratricopeptide (TPR) repeat protein